MKKLQKTDLSKLAILILNKIQLKKTKNKNLKTTSKILIIKKIYKKALKNVIIKISYKWPLQLSIQLKNKKNEKLLLKNLFSLKKSFKNS